MLALTKIAFSAESKRCGRYYHPWSCFSSSFPMALFFWPAVASSFLPNQINITLPDLSDPVTAIAYLACTLCPSQASVLAVGTPFSSKVFSFPPLFLSSCASPVWNVLHSSFISRCPHKAQHNSDLRKASPSYSRPFCTSSELLLRFLLILHMLELCYISPQGFSVDILSGHLGSWSSRNSEVGLWASVIPASARAVPLWWYIWADWCEFLFEEMV